MEVSRSIMWLIDAYIRNRPKDLRVNEPRRLPVIISLAECVEQLHEFAATLGIGSVEQWIHRCYSYVLWQAASRRRETDPMTEERLELQCLSFAGMERSALVTSVTLAAYIRTVNLNDVSLECCISCDEDYNQVVYCLLHGSFMWFNHTTLIWSRIISYTGNRCWLCGNVCLWE